MLAESYEPATNKVEIVLDRVAQAWPPQFWRDVTTVIAVSGGADSTALARALAAIQQPGEGRLVLVHFNHKLRGAESDADEAFVRNLATMLQFPVDIAHAMHVDAGGHQSEQAARDARYGFFREAASRWGARYIATAHTADDQVETVLHRIFRGTGIAGLAGIPRIRPLTEMTSLVRPMLDISRREVLEYLHALQQGYCVDSTNTSADFTRNRIRNELLPWLEQNVNEKARDAVLRLANQAEEAAELLRQQGRLLLDRCLIKQSTGQFSLAASTLRDTPAPLLRQMFVEVWAKQKWPEQAMTASDWLRLVEFSRNTNGPSIQLPGAIHAEQFGDELLLTQLNRPGD